MNKKTTLFIMAPLCLNFLAKAQSVKPDTSSLLKDTTELEEVVVNAGYYTVKDRERTGSIARVTAKTIEKQPVLNVLEALKGQMAGVDIQQTNGEPGGGFSIRIRGRSSLRSDANDPLYLINGVPFPSQTINQSIGNATRTGSDPLNVLNPDDILSIEVLKDADATAIYGSRGSNGVVLITTKQGSQGKPQLQLDLSQGAGKVSHVMDLLNTQQYVKMRTDGFANSGVTPTTGNAYDLLVWDTTRYTDWQKELLGGTAHQSRAQFSYSGGMASDRYLLAGGYQRQGNVYPGSFDYERENARLDWMHGQIEDRLSMHLSVNYYRDVNDLPSLSLTNMALTLPPDTPEPYDKQGNLNWAGSTFNNPMANLYNFYKTTSNTVNTNLVLNYRLNSEFQLRLTGGYNVIVTNERTHYPASAFDPIYAVPSRVDLSDNSYHSFSLEPQLSYERKIGPGDLKFLFGGSFQQDQKESTSLEASGVLNELMMANIKLATSITALDYHSSEYRYLAGFARLNYDIGGKYLLNLTARRDGSSRFGPGHQWGNFGAIGAAWLFGDETWFKKTLPWLNFGKLRASYGITGSDQIADYGYMTTYKGSSGVYNYLGAYLLPNGLANADFRWESNRKLEAALELGAWHDRIHVTAAWYRNRSGNQLVGYPLAAINGFTTVQYNLPAELQNSGWELEGQFQVLRGAAFQWALSLNYSMPSSKLLSYPGIEASSYARTYQIGQPTDIMNRYHYTGVDPETGMYTFEDVDGNGAYNTNDYHWLLPPPIRFGGMGNEFSYKGMSLSIFLQYDQRSRTDRWMFQYPGYQSNQPVGVMDYWKAGGDQTNIQKPMAASSVASSAYTRLFSSDVIAKKVRFLRLNNVAFGWMLPEAWVHRLGLGAVKWSVEGQNLAVIGRNKLLDPETDYNALPPLRTLSTSLQLTF